MIIAVDHGNSAIKTVNHVFTSGLKAYPDKPPMVNEWIQYQGAYWVLTERRIPLMLDKTENQDFFILTLFAIAKELMTMGSVQPYHEIDLAIGLPPEHFVKQRQSFAGYFKREELSFAYNSVGFSIKIRNVLVFPQAYAAVVPQGSRLKEMPQCYIVDIGGYTTDILLLQESRPDIDMCRSLEYGVIDMCNEIIGLVNTKHGIQLTEKQIVAAVQGKENKALSNDVVKMIHSEARRYIERIINSLREHKVELKANPAIFIGGGSVLFRQYIESSSLITSADFVPDTRANAIGYSILAAAKLKSS